jgi:superfamily II DNA or RNA helicase
LVAKIGKSLAGEDWIKHPNRGGNTYVICLKKNKKEWQQRCPNSTVLTKEEFRKNPELISNPTAILIDEVHHFHSPLFVAKKRSQLATALYTILKKYPNVHFMGLTGTPLTNDPASIHTLLVYLGKYIPWGEFQNRFYDLKYMPFLPRPAYFPIKNWREPANELLKQYTDIVSLRDCVDWLPPEIVEVVELKTKPKVYAEDEEYHWTKNHKHEQTDKPSKISEIGEGYRKVIVVAHYTEQIEELAKKLKSQKPVFILNGQTKDQQKVIREAQDSSDCYLITQAAMGEGFDGYMFDCMVFASMAHRVTHHTQMKARLDTLEKQYMKPKIYLYLLAGKWDKHIYDSVMQGEDFNFSKYEK